VDGFVRSDSGTDYRFKEPLLEAYHSRFGECVFPDEKTDLFWELGELWEG
jgi:hypothetical protein